MNVQIQIRCQMKQNGLRDDKYCKTFTVVNEIPEDVMEVLMSKVFEPLVITNRAKYFKMRDDLNDG